MAAASLYRNQPAFLHYVLPISAPGRVPPAYQITRWWQNKP
jgi:hypothetical protein